MLRKAMICMALSIYLSGCGAAHVKDVLATDPVETITVPMSYVDAFNEVVMEDVVPSWTTMSDERALLWLRRHRDLGGVLAAIEFVPIDEKQTKVVFYEYGVKPGEEMRRELRLMKQALQE